MKKRPPRRKKLLKRMRKLLMMLMRKPLMMLMLMPMLMLMRILMPLTTVRNYNSTLPETSERSRSEEDSNK